MFVSSTSLNEIVEVTATAPAFSVYASGLPSILVATGASLTFVTAKLNVLEVVVPAPSSTVKPKLSAEVCEPL